MEPDSSDEEDLWADVDEDAATSITVSENLMKDVGQDVQDAKPVHAGDADEGKLTWESPLAPGLQNSVKASEAKTRHWYNEGDGATAALAQSAPASTSAPMAAPAPAFDFGAFAANPGGGIAFPFPAAPAVAAVPSPTATPAAGNLFAAGGSFDWAALPKAGAMFG